MKWWQILIIVVVVLAILTPMLIKAVKIYVKEIKEWKKQKKALSEKDAPLPTKEDNLKQATKEFFVAFKPYFDYLEQGQTEQAAKFLFDFQANCKHKTTACNSTIKCPECPYGGLVSAFKDNE
ncbi:MAG: hypothetical protein NC218_02130 [Acetobacter sp.]|nr:hypothetical protein [Acetobacter sp.]